ncbi:MAG: hypothetical protein J6Y43_03840 [Clostridia bacterium]|nr:hypothetical protein [Clostridia bacterium]
MVEKINDVEHDVNWTSQAISPPALISDVTTWEDLAKRSKVYKKSQKKGRKTARAKKREFKRNPGKGSLRDYLFIDLLCNTWEGVLLYSLPGILSIFKILFGIDFSSWERVYETTLKSPFWIISAILLVPFVASALKYWAIWISCLHYDESYETFARIIQKIGVPRQGKTSSMNYEIVLAAKKMWAELKLRYAVYKYKFECGKIKTKEQLELWEEVKTSYEYCINSPAIPLLWTTTPIKVNGRFSNVLTKEHIAGRERLPFSAVHGIDEATRTFHEGLSLLKNDKKDWDISNMFALEGHFLGSIIYLASQDDNTFLDINRCVYYTEIMNRQTPDCKPWWLRFIVKAYDLLLKEAERKKAKTKGFYEFCIKRYIFWDDLCRRVGFRKFNSSKRGNRAGTNKFYMEEKEGKQLFGNSRNRTFWRPARLNCEYDDRTFRNHYPARNQEIRGEVFKSLVLQEGEFELQSTKTAFDIQLEKKKTKIAVDEALGLDKKPKNKRKVKNSPS